MKLNFTDEERAKYLILKGTKSKDLAKELRISHEKLQKFLEGQLELGSAKDRLARMFNSFIKDEMYFSVRKTLDNEKAKNYDYEDLSDINIPCSMKLKSVFK